MKVFKRLLLGFISAYFLMGATFSQAQDMQGPPQLRARFEKGIQEVFSQLNLTDDQKQKLEANKKENRARMENFHHDMRANMGAMQAELMKRNLDMGKINTIQQQIKSIQNQMEDNKLASILAVRSILTPDQFSKFLTLMHKRKQDHDK